jgi:hypothetical protein
MFIVNWVFDKLGYMPKVSIDTCWHFPVVAPKATPVVKKATTKPTVKKATTRKKKD